MKLLRDNLISLPATEDGGSCYLEDPETGKRYEFDQQEYYLANAIRGPYHAVVLLAKFNAQFRSNMVLDQLKAFLSRLEGWGLLNEQEGLAAVESQDAVVKTEYATVSETNETSFQRPDVDETSSRSRPDRAETRENFPGTFYLFCPEGLLRTMVSWFGFTRHLVKLLPVFVLVALIGLLFNLENFAADFTFSRIDFNLIKHLIFTLFTINLGNLLIKGSIASYFGVPTPAFGLMMAFGLIPRFSLPMKIPPDSPKKVKMWLSSSSILIRAVLFSAGIFVWLITRESGHELPLYAISLAFIAVVSNIFVSNPLMESDGYRLLTLYFDKPDLRQRAYRALKYSTSKQPAVIAQYVETNTYLKVYALACVAFIVFVLAVVSWIAANWLESNYRGLGIAVFILLVIYQFRRFKAPQVAKQKGRGGNAQGSMAGRNAQGLIERRGYGQDA